MFIFPIFTMFDEEGGATPSPDKPEETTPAEGDKPAGDAPSA